MKRFSVKIAVFFLMFTLTGLSVFAAGNEGQQAPAPSDESAPTQAAPDESRPDQVQPPSDENQPDQMQPPSDESSPSQAPSEEPALSTVPEPTSI